MSHKRNSVMLLMGIVLSAPALIHGQSSGKLNQELPAGAMQQKTATACLECHEARIIVQQRLSKAVWTREVDKMMKWGAVLDAADRDALVDYLSTNFSPEQPAYSASRTAQVKKTVKSTAQKSGR